MKDVQNQKDDRNIYLNEVGIKNLVYPIEIRKKDGSWQQMRAEISLSADLNGNQKGTHMSRFVDIIQENNRIEIHKIRRVLETIKERLSANKSRISLNFDYFIEKNAPVSGKESFLNVNVQYLAWLEGDNFEFEMTVNTPVTTLCPCSKEISNYSAHNQRANVAVTLRTGRFIWIEDIVELSERAASSPVYTLLKRPDEKYVTEHAYNNPRFVEDLCRELKMELQELQGIGYFAVEVESYESIHNHSAYARVTGHGTRDSKNTEPNNEPSEEIIKDMRNKIRNNLKKTVLRDGRELKYNNGEMLIMGIINATPDSFYGGSRTPECDDAVERASKMIVDGATMIDVGGESTRPGSEPVSEEEEIKRVCPVIREIKNSYPETIVSIDTYHAKTARAAIESGADIINDISALTFDPEMVEVVKEFNVPVILMHINGRPKTMQKNPVYGDVVSEVHDFLRERIDFAIKNGIPKNKIIIDMGIGFGKTYEHNIELLRNISAFDDLGCPHLLAVSRKSFIGTCLGEKDPSDRLPATIANTLYAQSKGIEIARVHDVKENYQAARMFHELIYRKTEV